MQKPSRWVRVYLVWALLFVTATSCGSLGSDRDFFRGQTVTIIVPHGAGGGVDTYARTVAPFLQKYLPGSRVVVENVTENGGLTGKNRIFAAAPDGLTLGFTPVSGALLGEWGERPGIEYRTAEFSLIGRLAANAHVLAVSPKSGLTTLPAIVQKGTFRMGFSGVVSDDYYVALIAANLLGYQVEARTDYPDASEAWLACVKGEVDGVLFADSNLLPQIEAQTLIPIASFSPTRTAELPAVPTIFEYLPADQQGFMQAVVQLYALDRIMIAPPNLPPDRLQTLRTALDQAVADPEFLQNMAAVHRPVNYLSGAETAALLVNLMGSEAEIKPRVLAIVHESP